MNCAAENEHCLKDENNEASVKKTEATECNTNLLSAASKQAH